MHSRNVSNTLINNYDKAVYDFESEKGIKSIIEEFWQEENEMLKEQTWLALAKSQVEKIFQKIQYDTNNEQFIIDKDLENDQLYSEYDDNEALKQDLTSYLIDEIEIKNYSVSEENKIELETIISNKLSSF